MDQGLPIQPPDPKAPPRSSQSVRNKAPGTGSRKVERPAQGSNRPVEDRDSVVNQYARERAGIRG